MRLIAQGAEAKLFQKKKSLLKDRVKKSYRISEIDSALRKSRTRREAKILQKLEDLNFPAPRLIKTDTKQKIEMEFVEGPKLRDVFKEKYAEEIGEKIAILHSNGIIHGDLTTSNMLLNKEIYFIDFGLSFFSKRVEDKAVDLHLFRQALESKHYKIWKKAFQKFISGYKNNVVGATEILQRLELVESRGRHKSKI